MSSHADDIKEFEIEGISIGDSLLDYLSKEEIIKGIEFNKPAYKNYSNDFGEVYIFDNFESYDRLSFKVKPDDKKYQFHDQILKLFHCYLRKT